MRAHEKVFIWTIAILVGACGGVASRLIPTIGQAKVQDVVASREFLVIDQDSKGYAILGIDHGEPKLKFYGDDHKVMGYVGLQSNEPALSFTRRDGSAAWLMPNDESSGWHLSLLKSLGEGKGVYMSMFTSDEVSIYQSGLGGITLGNVDGKLRMNVEDVNDKMIWSTSPQPSPSSERK